MAANRGSICATAFRNRSHCDSIAFTIQPAPSVSTWGDESSAENMRDTENGGEETQEIAGEQEDNAAGDMEPEAIGEEPEQAEN